MFLGGENKCDNVGGSLLSGYLKKCHLCEFKYLYYMDKLPSSGDSLDYTVCISQIRHLQHYSSYILVLAIFRLVE